MSYYKVVIEINSNLDKESFNKRAEGNAVEAAIALDPEIRRFEKWMMKRGMEQLSKVEEQILREYLGFKLTV